jgi:hypothetical protein
LWIFPVGTVLHSDGTTPIATSTAQQPDVDIPTGGGIVILMCNNFSGNYSLNDNNTDANYVGDLADLQGKITYFLSLYNCTNITGSLADLQGKITYYLNLYNCTNITGVYTPVGSGTPTYTYLDYTGLSSTDMDNTLIAYDAAGKTNGTFRANEMTRTASSDTAVSNLTTKGWSISGITKV